MYYCIVNPSARSGKGKDIWNRLEYKFLEKKLEYEVHLTKGPGHATRIAKKLTENLDSREDLPVKLVVMGGDGTLNEVMNGIMDFENTLVGYIPIGSSNDFARDLAFPKKIDDLLDQIVDGNEKRRLDLEHQFLR